MDKVAEILQSIQHMEPEILKKTLAYLLKTYVMDRGLSYEGEIVEPAAVPEPARVQAIVNNDSNRDQINSFYDLVIDMKNRYNFGELDYFEIEENNIYFKIDNIKKLISENVVKGPEAPSTAPPANSNPAPGQSQNRFKNLEMDQ